MIFNSREVKGSILVKLANGLDLDRACRASGISKATFYNLCKKDSKFKEKAKDVRYGFMSDKLESLLYNLATGEHQSEEDISTWIEEQADGTKVQRTKKIKKLPPNERAIGMLAKKYNKELTTNEIQINHEIGITIKDRALTIEERRSILEMDRNEGAIDTVAKEIVS